MGLILCSCMATEALKLPSNHTTSEKACSFQSALILSHRAVLCSLLVELIGKRVRDWRAHDSELIAAWKMVYLVCDWSVHIWASSALGCTRLKENKVVQNSPSWEIVNTRISQQGVWRHPCRCFLFSSSHPVSFDFCDMQKSVMSSVSWPWIQVRALIVLSWLPVTSVAYLLFVRHLGGILAVANIRGGGEYGLTWHKGKDRNQIGTSGQARVGWITNQPSP